MADAQTVTLTIESDDGTTDELEVPAALLDMFAEGGETPPEVVGDIAMLGFAQQVHGAVHHSQGEVDERLAETEERTLELFEERFGQSLAEITGHSH